MAFDSTADQQKIEIAIKFFIANSRGMWHNRARARLARKFKWVTLTMQDRSRLLETIIRKWHEGEVDEQFRDQLHLAIHFDCPRIEQLAFQAVTDRQLSSTTLQLAHWVLRLLHDRRRSKKVC